MIRNYKVWEYKMFKVGDIIIRSGVTNSIHQCQIVEVEEDQTYCYTMISISTKEKGSWTKHFIETNYILDKSLVRENKLNELGI